MIDRPKEPPKFDDDDDDFGNAFPSERPTTPVSGEPVVEERPTVSPPFDVEEYAKTSDSKVRAMKSNPATPDEAATKPPPPLPDFDFADDLPPAPGRARQVTLTDEDELETARLRSVLMASDPPPRKGAGRPNRSASDRDEAPPTVAYPAEYERDPFARLGGEGEPADDLGPRLTDMRDRFALGDYTGALEVAQVILEQDPTHPEAVRCSDDSQNKLVHMYTARIGPLDRVPMVMVAREQLRWLSIDHRAGFLLSHIDGVSSLEMILDVSGMPLLDALKILCELSQQRVISFR